MSEDAGDSLALAASKERGWCGEVEGKSVILNKGPGFLTANYFSCNIIVNVCFINLW